MEQDTHSRALPKNFQLKGYVIKDVLGRSPFTNTYLAADGTDESLVVIKELFPMGIAAREADRFHVVPARPGDEGKEFLAWACDWFYGEAETLRELEHPNIAKTLNHFKSHNTVYLVTPYIPGVSLEEWAHAHPTPESATVVRMLLSLLSALKHIHEQGMGHHDISAANIIVKEGDVPVLRNFGTARHAISRRTPSRAGAPGYTPFEQRQSRGNVGPWSDLYALGATFHRLISGACPPDSQDRVTEADPYKPLAKNPKLVAVYGKDLLAGIDKALRMKPAKRWQSAVEWRKDILSYCFPYGYDAEDDETSAAGDEEDGTPKPVHLSPLMQAACAGDTATVGLLLDAGGEIDVCDKTGRTPLLHAAEAGHVRTVYLLLSQCAYIDTTDKDGHSALMLAARNGHTAVAEYLLAAGADADLQSNSGKTALMYAASYGHSGIYSILLQGGASTGIRDNRGHDAFWHAVHPHRSAHGIDGGILRAMVTHHRRKDFIIKLIVAIAVFMLVFLLLRI